MAVHHRHRANGDAFFFLRKSKHLTGGRGIFYSRIQLNMGAARRNPKRNSSWVDKSVIETTRETVLEKKSQKQTVPVRSLIMNFQSLFVQVQRAMRY